jgi:hypothetical protein
MHIARLGDRVRVQFTHVGSSAAVHDPPSNLPSCEFIVGGPEVVSSLSLGVLGMTLGDRKRLTLRPEETGAAGLAETCPTLPSNATEFEVLLMSLDASSDANESKPQFDHGGES